jgi:hypothetical protein
MAAVCFCEKRLWRDEAIYFCQDDEIVSLREATRSPKTGSQRQEGEGLGDVVLLDDPMEIHHLKRRCDVRKKQFFSDGFIMHHGTEECHGCQPKGMPAVRLRLYGIL